MKRCFRKSKSRLLLLLMLPLFAYAQAQIAVTGTVSSASDGLSLPGANILVKGTTTGTVSDLDGNFSISVPDGNAILVVSSVGFLEEEIVVGEQSVINVVLVEDITKLEEIIVIGYGTAKKKEIAGAVAKVKSDELMQTATSDLGTALQGLVAGVNVQASSGAPGASSNIQIRGISSVSGTNDPLFVVDGIPQDGDPRLSNSEIESVDILKDAASAAIYGTRGAAGVILITTKQGKAGQMKISLNSYAGIQKITSGIPLQNFEETIYATMLNNRNNTTKGNDQKIWTPLESNADGFTNNTNLLNTIQNDNAIIQNHSLNISGGNNDLTYSIVGSYFQQDGVLINSGFDRISARGNTTYKRGKWTVNTTIGFGIEEREHAPYQLLYEAYKYKPYQQTIDPNMETISDAGNAGSNQSINLSNMARKFKQSDVENGEKFNGHLRINYEIIKGLNINSTIASNYNNTDRLLINPLFVVYNNDGDLVTNGNRSQIKNTSGRSTGYSWETGANYEKMFRDHKIKLLGVYTMEKYTYSEFFGQKFDLVNNQLPVINGGTLDPNAGSGTKPWNRNRVSTLVGMIGRLQYDYQGKYILSLSARRDGSSRFAKANRWGVFPSVSAAWNISDESFWTSLNHIVNAFKLRASYGTTGNQSFADYSFSPTVQLNNDYAFGPEGADRLVIGMIQTAYANADVQWETNVQSNAGIDLALFENKVTFSADFYNTNKQEMLFPLLLPPGTGAGQNSNVVLNFGNMNNRGLELALGFKKAGLINWGVTGTFSKNVNKVTKMSGTNKTSYFTDGTVVDGISEIDKVTVIAEGYEAGAFFLMETNGLVYTEEQLVEYQKLVPDAKFGDLIYVDRSGDGIINDEDRYYAGSGTPDFETGIVFNCNYKSFDFSMHWYASVGNEVINGSKVYSYMFGSHKDLVYQWNVANPTAVIPANRARSHNNMRAFTDKWVEDGTFIRLRNITLGYSLPNSLSNKLGVSKFRVYLAAQNPITITKYQGYDPEVGNDGLATKGLDKGNYPVSSQYRLGIQLDF